MMKFVILINDGDSKRLRLNVRFVHWLKKDVYSDEYKNIQLVKLQIRSLNVSTYSYYLLISHYIIENNL